MTEILLKSGLHLPYNLIDVERVIKDLTWKMKDFTSGEMVELQGFQERDYDIVVPRNFPFEKYWDTDNFMDFVQIVDQRSSGREIIDSGKPIIPRNKDQETFINKIYTELFYNKSAYGVASCGVGKSFLCIDVIKRYKRSTAVIVPTKTIMDQWVDYLVNGQPEEGVDPAWPECNVGICQGDRCDTGNTHDVVICMIQSLYSRDYGEEFYNSFGLCVIDEAHKITSPKWNKVIFDFNPKVWLPLTATPERNDNTHELLYMHTSKPTVIIKNYEVKPKIFGVPIKERYQENYYRWKSKGKKVFSRARALNKISVNDVRNDRIAKDIKKAIKEGRKILAIGERHVQFTEIEKRFADSSFDDFGWLVASKEVPGKRDPEKMVKRQLTKEEEAEAKKCQVVWTTYQKAEVGMNDSSIDVIIIMNTRAHLEQTVGRSTREREGKKQPIIVIYLDEFIPEFYYTGVNAIKELEGLGFETKIIGASK